MTKLITPLLVLSLAALTGCELYFGGHHNGDRWNYCANDGYYVCNGDECTWAGPRCPDDPSYTCDSNDDCAAGCYCSADGVCEEAGFCGSQADCPEGFYCEIERSSCVPESCTDSDQCDAGEYCTENGACEASCTCTTDAEAQAAGWGHCDEARGTCEPTPVAGTCGGASTCNIAEPTCAPGEVALIADGCYTGSCSAIAACDVAPTCAALQHEADCLGANTSCSSVYYGINCTTPGGTACTAGDANCTCQSFQYADCRDRTSSMMVFENPAGTFTDVFAR
jgi:hypothetical protein